MNAAPRYPLRLVVVPNDPIHLYERAGYEGLQDYFNPAGMFGEVIVLSPLEKGERRAYGMTIRGVAERKFKTALAEIRPDVVRAYAGDWPADLVCRSRLPRVPIVVSVHDSSRERMHRSLSCADLVVCTSATVAERVREIGVLAERVRILPNRVDTTTFKRVTDPDRLATLTQRYGAGRFLLHVGRKVPEKNLDTVIRALALLPDDYSCIFIGMGEREPYLQLARDVGVNRRCIWIDAVKNSDLPLWYSWCDCFCVPSRAEGFGTVFIEAAACGAAIVTANIPPMNAYLLHDETAYLVDDYTEPRAVARAVQTVSEQPEYRQRLMTAAVGAARPFEKGAVDAAEAAIYREALALGAPSLLRQWHFARWRIAETVEARKAQFRRVLTGSRRAARTASS